MFAYITLILILISSFFVYGLLFAYAFNFGKIFSIAEVSSLIIASAALFTSCYQTYISRNHNKISVRPKIKIIPSLAPSTNHSVGILVKNQGLGPAIIEDLIIRRTDNIGRLLDLSFKKIVPNWAKDFVRFEAIGKDSVIPPGDGSWIVETSSENYQIFVSEFSELTIEISYKSMYNEFFISSCRLSKEFGTDKISIFLDESDIQPIS